MSLNSVKIIQNGRFAEVFVDGIKVNGVTSIKYEIDLEHVASLKLEMYVAEIEIESNEVEVNQEESK